MRLQFTYIFLLFWQIMPFYTIAQIGNLRFEKVEIPDEIPLSNTDCIYEDSKGFQWFGTYEGLFMYDGYKMKHYKNNPNDPLSMSDNKITCMLEDEKGNFWIGTQNGVNYFDSKKHTFKRYNEVAKSGIGITWVACIRKDGNNNIWVGMESGLYLFDSTHQKFIQPFTQFNNIKTNNIEFGIHGYYVQTQKGLYFKNYKSDTFTLVNFPISNASRKDFRFALQMQDENNILFTKTTKGIFFINQNINDTLLINEPLFNDDTIRHLIKKGKDELWIENKTGLYIFNTKTHSRQLFTFNPQNPESYPESQIYNMYYTSSKILWIHAVSGITYKVDMHKQQFQNVPIRLGDYIPSVNCIFDMYEYSLNTLWIRQKKGSGLLDMTTGKITPFIYKPDHNLDGWERGIICFLEERDNKLWIGTDRGLFLFDKMTKRFTNLDKQIKGLEIFKNCSLRKIYRDKQGILWVVTWNIGVIKIDFAKKTLKQYLNINYHLSNARSLLETKNGQIWVGTRGGLCKYMPEADSFKIYKNELTDPESISENTAFCIYEDEEENIWVGTYGGGLNKLDVKTGKFKHFTTENGLINNNVFAIVPDKKGNYWLGTFKGISVFNPSTETFQSFNNKSGLINNAFTGFLYGKGRYSDRFFFGGDNGIDFFNPDSIKLSTLDPRIYITDFKLFNKTVPISKGEKDSKTFYLNEDISFTKQLTLAYEQNVIGFEYAALDYSAPKNIQYAYQLEGFDTAWQYVGNQRSTTFTNLNPGDYTFKVKATNGDGVWGTKTASLKLTVLAPWWQTWWFRGLVGLTLFSLGFAFYQYRINQIKEKETLKMALNQRIAEVEMDALRSQMSPHFIFNCLSAITRFILNHENEAATLYLTKFSRLVRLVLNHSQMDTIPLSKELEAIRLYLEMEALRFHDKFRYTLQVDAQLDIPNIHIPPMLIQPYIENAVWHGLLPKKSDDKHLIIDMTNGDESLTIRIEDNGIGRQKAAENKSKTALTDEYKSFGMALTEERLDMINKMKMGSAHVQIMDLKNENGEATGTRVVLTIPIKLLPNKKNHS